MSNLWSALVPLIIGSAFVPIQIIITILLLRSAAGKKTALAWVAGMTTVRLLQGLIFGLILSSGSSDAEASGGNSSSTVVTGVLLVVAVLLLVTGVRQLVTDVDPEAPPPKWLTMTETMGPGKAFVFGAGLLAIGAKFWIFTLGAISSIGDADLGRTSSILTFLAFVALTEVAHLAVLGLAIAAPAKSEKVLAAASAWLTRNNRTIMIVISFVFGTWFMVKSLHGLGIL